MHYLGLGFESQSDVRSGVVTELQIVVSFYSPFVVPPGPMKKRQLMLMLLTIMEGEHNSECAGADKGMKLMKSKVSWESMLTLAS